MVRPPRETTEWVGGLLVKEGLAIKTTVLSDTTLRVERDNKPTFEAAVISRKVVRTQDVQPYLGGSVQIVANIPKDGLWTGDAIECLAGRRIAFGSLGDLMSATYEPDVPSYVRKEYDFVERGLRQHSRVTRIEREFDRVFKVHRAGGGPVTVALLNEYELTGDHIRSAVDRYGSFDVVLKTNPNGRITRGAYEVAELVGVQALRWGELLHHLAKV